MNYKDQSYYKKFHQFLKEDEEILGSTEVVPLSQINKDAAQAAISGGTQDGSKPDDAVAGKKVSIAVKNLRAAQTEIIPGKAIGIALNTMLKEPVSIGGDLGSIISKDKDIACFIMEVTRDIKPKKNYLNRIRKICNDNNIILIFDECTTGFRETYGGIHMKYKIYPDIAMFGKAIGNGYAITAILGKKKIMECSKNTFISSTFWSERIGPTAAIATLDYMKKHKSWIQIKKKGKYIKKQIIKIAEKNKLKINVSDLDSIIRFDFANIKNKNFFYKEFINEMLKRGFLASNFLYVSLSHTSKLIELYLRNFDETLKKINVSN